MIEIILPVVYGPVKYDFKGCIPLIDILKYVENKHKITIPRMAVQVKYKGEKYKWITDTQFQIKKGAIINIRLQTELGIYVKWHNEWISNEYDYHNFYRDYPEDMYFPISHLKNTIKKHLKIDDEIKLVYMSGRPINDDDKIYDVFGFLGQDIIARLKYEKYVTVMFEYSMLSDFVDMMENGRYYKGHKRNKPKLYNIVNGKKTKDKARVERLENPEDFPNFVKYDEEITEFIKKYKKFDWLESYKLYKVKYWMECGSSSICAFCFRLNSIPNRSITN